MAYLATQCGASAVAVALLLGPSARAEPTAPSAGVAAAPSPTVAATAASPAAGAPAGATPAPATAPGATPPAPSAVAPSTGVAPSPSNAAPGASTPPAGTVAPAPVAPVATPNAAPSAAPPVAPQARALSVAAPGEARVHLASDYAGAWLEGRSHVDEDGWHRLCAAPCDRAVAVDAQELRVTAPGMTSSNAFLIEPGTGTAQFRVSGGSARARLYGLIGLAGGLPITFAGVTLLGVGSIRDQQAEKTAGIVTLSVGAAVVLAALPLLLIGSTSVKNATGRHVARERRVRNSAALSW